MRKQGRADRDVRESTAPTPVSKSVSPGGATQPGTIEYKGSRPMYDGNRGFQSPAAKAREYNQGSQGKYK
jgi:hypothetical protein